MKGYITSNTATLRNEPSSELLLQLISASVKITNSTHIYTQPSLINAFISTVVVEDSKISSMHIDEHGSIEIISSSLRFSGMTLENITTVLEYAGSSIEDVFKCTVFLADIAEFQDMNAVYRTFFPENPPARSTVAGSGLALGARVEIECMAIAP